MEHLTTNHKKKKASYHVRRNTWYIFCRILCQFIEYYRKLLIILSIYKRISFMLILVRPKKKHLQIYRWWMLLWNYCAINIPNSARKTEMVTYKKKVFFENPHSLCMLNVGKHFWNYLHFTERTDAKIERIVMKFYFELHRNVMFPKKKLYVMVIHINANNHISSEVVLFNWEQKFRISTVALSDIFDFVIIVKKMIYCSRCQRLNKRHFRRQTY